MLERETFLEQRNRYLSAARPIQSPEHLKGRERALHELIDALKSPGRHAFIYGYRGVGKTSLAQTCAFQLQRASRAPVIVSCEPGSTFSSVMKDIVAQTTGHDPMSTARARQIGLGGSVAGTGANLSVATSSAQVDISISTVADAVSYLMAAGVSETSPLVVVIDEFDQITDRDQHAKFANLIKQISDRSIFVKVILCGIADSVQSLFSEHQSIFRQVHATDVQRIGLQARLDIMDDALKALEMSIPRGLQYRIAQISDGFPSFVHLIAEKVITSTFEAGLSDTDGASYDRGLASAIQSVELTLKTHYESAVHRNTKKLEPLVWAIAADKLLEVNVDAIWRNYLTICEDIKVLPEDRKRIASYMSAMCKPNYGSILFRQRHANYTFAEKMMRAYARLRAEKEGCQIGAENPDYVKLPEAKALIDYFDHN